MNSISVSCARTLCAFPTQMNQLAKQKLSEVLTALNYVLYTQ